VAIGEVCLCSTVKTVYHCPWPLPWDSGVWLVSLRAKSPVPLPSTFALCPPPHVANPHEREESNDRPTTITGFRQQTLWLPNGSVTWLRILKWDSVTYVETLWICKSFQTHSLLKSVMFQNSYSLIWLNCSIVWMFEQFQAGSFDYLLCFIKSFHFSELRELSWLYLAAHVHVKRHFHIHNKTNQSSS
jgi:hypothetical protein